MGFKKDRFGDQAIDDELVCKVCQDVLENPKQTAGCEHCFCGRCITNWLNGKQTCPSCEGHIQRDTLQAPSKLLLKLLARLQICCEYKEYGCRDVLSLASISEHQTLCPFSPEGEVTCEKGCGLIIRRRELATHECMAELKKKLRFQDESLRMKENTICQLARDIQLQTQTISQLISVKENQRRHIDDLERKLGEYQKKKEVTMARE